MCVLASMTPGQPWLPSSLRCHLHHVHLGHTGDVCSHGTFWNINSKCLRVWSSSQWWVKAIHPSDGWEVSPTSKKTLPHLFNCVGEGGCQQQPYKWWGDLSRVEPPCSQVLRWLCKVLHSPGSDEWQVPALYQEFCSLQSHSSMTEINRTSTSCCLPTANVSSTSQHPVPMAISTFIHLSQSKGTSESTTHKHHNLDAFIMIYSNPFIIFFI